MVKLSVVFTCRGRPNLTEIILRRFLDVINIPFQFIIAYDGNDKNYIDMLESIYSWDEIVTNPNRKRWFVDMWNDAYALADGDYYMHLENDFYCTNVEAIPNSIWALENYPDVDMIRMEIIPWRDDQMKEFRLVPTEEIGLIKKFADGGPGYQFVLNPHIRRDQYPVEGGWPKTPPKGHFEAVLAKQWEGEEKQTACLYGDNWRHIGVYAEGGSFKGYYIERFTLIRWKYIKGMNEYIRDFDPVIEFMQFCSEPLYIELFKRYINGKGINSGS